MANNGIIQSKVPQRPPHPPAYQFPGGYCGGINTQLSPDLIRENETPDCCNISFDDGGVPTKRKGWEKLNASSWGATPIRGMYEFWKIGASEPIFLVAWGGKIWSVASDGTKTSLMSSPANITDTTTGFFTMNDTCYAYTGTEFVQYTGSGTVATVVGYVPKYTTGRSPDGTTSAADEELNLLSNSWKDVFTGTVAATDYHLSFTGLSATLVKAWVDGVEKTETTDFTVNRTTGVVTFSVAPGAVQVIIQAEKDNLNDPTDITKCTIFSVYGGKEDTRVFAAGHPTLVNYRWRSYLVDPTYWPISAFELITSDAEAVTGFGRMIDYQIIYKEYSQQYSYVNEVSGVVSFPVLPLNDEYGCASARTIAPAQGGLLALSYRGVIWTQPSLVRGQANCKMISAKVNDTRTSTTQVIGILDHTKAEIEAAFSILINQKYYLHIDDTVWILDLKYSDLVSGIYCWYRYTGLPGSASCFLDRSGDLYFGDNTNGLVYKPIDNVDPMLEYNDDGAAIDSYWFTPFLFMGLRNYIKKFERLNLTFAGQPDSGHQVSVYTDQGPEDIALTYSDSRSFDYSRIYYDDWTYGLMAYPQTESERVGYKGEYIQYRLRNNTLNQGMTVLSQSLEYSIRKKVR